ncbi:MAG: NAD-dependent protein deacylase [Coriobacteriales bacterium]|nr:NAD-dependent protein deacylase [Coriobacteriales bacterium]
MKSQSFQKDIEKLKTWIDECSDGKLVFFGGAGVSTESGIPDFRSANGIFMQDLGSCAIESALKSGDIQRANKLKELKFSPEQIVSHSFFDAFPEEFYSFYFNNMIFKDANPNAAHEKLAELEKSGKLGAVITQNIDGLHQKAGCNKVFELHGSVLRNYCMKCGKFYNLESLIDLSKNSDSMVPYCEKCGGTVKPDVVLYEEGLDQTILQGSINAISNAEVLIVAGTSLVVNPAASLIQYFRGKRLVIVNLSPTYADSRADLCIQAKVGEVFSF